MRDTCPHCGSKKIIPDLPIIVEVITGGGSGVGSATVKIAGAPEAWFAKDIVSGDLTVRVCGECGHAELQVSNVAALYEKYEKARQS